MSFDLHVKISGLCLLVPDASGKALHVLMPTTGKKFDGCDGAPVTVVQHVARLVHYRMYEAGTVPSGSENDWIYEDIQGTDQTVGDGKANSADTRLGPTIGHIVAPVPVKYLTMPVADPLAARVTITAGAPVDYVSGAFWDIGPKLNQELSPGMNWAIMNMPGSTLTVKTRGGTKTLREVGGSIEIGIYCVPDGELPGQSGGHHHHPGPHDTPPHYPAYLRLCDLSGIPNPSDLCPRFHSDPRTVHMTGTSPFTCMLATSP